MMKVLKMQPSEFMVKEDSIAAVFEEGGIEIQVADFVYTLIRPKKLCIWISTETSSCVNLYQKMAFAHNDDIIAYKGPVLTYELHELLTTDEVEHIMRPIYDKINAIRPIDLPAIYRVNPPFPLSRQSEVTFQLHYNKHGEVAYTEIGIPKEPPPTTFTEKEWSLEEIGRAIDAALDARDEVLFYNLVEKQKELQRSNERH